MIDNRSQYLGRFGTVESHALYHLLCLNKLLTGSAPTTRDVREQLSRLANETPPARPLHNRPSFQLAALLATACLSMLLGAGAVTTWNRDPEVVQLNKPVLAEARSDGGNTVPIPSVDEVEADLQRLGMMNPQKAFSEILDQATKSIREIERRIEDKERQDAPTVRTSVEEQVSS